MAHSEQSGYAAGRVETSRGATVATRAGSAASGLIAGLGTAAGSRGGLFAAARMESVLLGGALSARMESARAALAQAAIQTGAAGFFIAGEGDTFGLAIPLSDPLPLRDSTAWGRYVSPVALPVGYGRVTIAPIPYDNGGRVFFLLDHAIQAVERVTRDDVDDTRFTLENTTDGDGHAVSLLRLAIPAAGGEKIAVTLRGRMNPDTGELLLNPADILWDLLANLCGLPVAYGDLDALRAQCRESGMELHGVLESGEVTIRVQIDEIMASCGGVWSGGMPGIARLYP